MALRGRVVPAAPVDRALRARRYVVFALTGGHYAVDARRVRYSVPASEVRGAAAVFLGQRYPLFDLRALFGYRGPVGAGRLVLLVEGEGARAALPVDGLVELAAFGESTLFPLPAVFRGAEQRWFEGLIRDGSRVIVVLRVEGILEGRGAPRAGVVGTPAAG